MAAVRGHARVSTVLMVLLWCAPWPHSPFRNGGSVSSMASLCGKSLPPPHPFELFRCTYVDLSAMQAAVVRGQTLGDLGARVDIVPKLQLSGGLALRPGIIQLFSSHFWH